MITKKDIFTAVSAWEQLELVNAPITRAPNLVAFPTYPTRDVATILQLPFTCHWGLDTKWQLGSVRAGNGSIEDVATYHFGAGLAFALQKDDLDKIVLRDSDWTSYYRQGFLLHLQLGLVVPGGAHSATMEMLETYPWAFHLFGVHYGGIWSHCTATIRQSMQTGLG